MTAQGPICFWSYTHRDNDLEGGRIRRLAESIGNEYELLTGQKLELFVDSSAIAWGDEWKSVINDALASTAFFIPVVTPLYLRSVECRREFLEFSARAKRFDAPDLLLPILYSDVSSVPGSDEDEIVRSVKTTHREDWRSLRLGDEQSEVYRTRVHKLATRLVELVAAESIRPLPSAPSAISDEGEAGFLDEVANAEENVDSWHITLAALLDEVRNVAAATETASNQMKRSDTHRGGARGRLAAVQQYANELSEPSQRIHDLGHEYARSVFAADAGVRAVIARSKEEIAAGGSRNTLDSFSKTIRSLAEKIEEMSASVRIFLGQIEGGERISRVLAAPLNRMRSGLSAVVDAETVINGWVPLLSD